MKDVMSDGAVMGRPTIYSDELAQSICEQLMVGVSLRKICAIDGMPAMSTVMQWLSSGNQDFMEQYAHARTIQAEYLLDESLDIADATIAETAEVAKSKLQIDTRKWMIEKLAPKKYGAKMEVDNKSSDGSMTPVAAPDYSRLSDDELRQYAKLESKAASDKS